VHRVNRVPATPGLGVVRMMQGGRAGSKKPVVPISNVNGAVWKAPTPTASRFVGWNVGFAR
jgi:hypothetical protein